MLSKEGIVLVEIESPADQSIRVYNAMVKNKGTRIIAINFFLLTNL